MYRTHTCGELRIKDINKNVELCGWVQRIRDKGKMIWIDLRDRYGITQLVAEEGKTDSTIIETIKKTGREFVISAKGNVIERVSKNPNVDTGEIEIEIKQFDILNHSDIPPFTIEDDTDGGEELRMKYRYLDLRRNPLQKNIKIRHEVAIQVRQFLHNRGFYEIETPMLIKSTPEGARDFVVPSRLHTGSFYALPQSPQTFKQLLMVSGFDKYFQIVKCFRDEDFRADRQPEFTQIDCEMAFVHQEDIQKLFEAMMTHVFKQVIGIDLPEFKTIIYQDAMKYYGSDKPDMRFDMRFCELNDVAKEKGFAVFDNSELVVAINAKGCANYSRKQLDKLTKYVQTPQVGAKGLVYVKCNEDGSFKSSVDKFFEPEDFSFWMQKCDAQKGDLLLILAGATNATRKAMSALRLYMAKELNLAGENDFAPLWVVDFPLLEWDEETQRHYAMHHPFTSPKKEDIQKLQNEPNKVSAYAYDMVINGVEIGGGSIRIHENELQKKVFKALGFTEEEAEKQFGFLLNAFKYGAPPHGGIAFGFDRICALLSGIDSIRDFIAFPKNNSGRDVMLDSPSKISDEQLKELKIKHIE